MAPVGLLRGDFVHYPNLSAVSLRNAGVDDIPRGLLDLASRTLRAVPATRPHPSSYPVIESLRLLPPPTHYFTWELSHNRIEELSVPALISLIWFAHESRARMMPFVELEGRRSPRVAQLARPVTLAVNLWGNPVTRKVPRPAPQEGRVGKEGDGDRGGGVLERQNLLWDQYLDRRLAEVWERIAPKMQAQQQAQREETAGSEPPLNPAWIALKFWHTNRAQVSRVVGRMLVSVRPDVFRADTMRTYDAMMERQRYRWMI